MNELDAKTKHIKHLINSAKKAGIKVIISVPTKVN